MLNKHRSVVLTHLMVRLFYFILFAVTIAACWQPYNVVIKNGLDTLDILFLVPFYISVPFGFVALVCLDKLLINIKKSIVFHEKNIRYLCIFSWLCLIVSIITVIFAVVFPIKGYIYFKQAADNVLYFPIFEYLYSAFLIAISVAEFFVGLVVRVVKNTFEAAIEIKDENDLTI